jgi:hypothetical protein
VSQKQQQQKEADKNILEVSYFNVSSVSKNTKCNLIQGTMELKKISEDHNLQQLLAEKELRLLKILVQHSNELLNKEIQLLKLQNEYEHLKLQHKNEHLQDKLVS